MEIDIGDFADEIAEWKKLKEKLTKAETFLSGLATLSEFTLDADGQKAIRKAQISAKNAKIRMRRIAMNNFEQFVEVTDLEKEQSK